MSMNPRRYEQYRGVLYHTAHKSGLWFVTQPVAGAGVSAGSGAV